MKDILLDVTLTVKMCLAVPYPASRVSAIFQDGCKHFRVIYTRDSRGGAAGSAARMSALWKENNDVGKSGGVAVESGYSQCFIISDFV